MTDKAFELVMHWRKKEHLLSFNLPESLMARMGRLVGHMELQKRKICRTSLDVTPERRNEVFWQKNLLIGCGGGYQQECKTCLEA